MCKHNQIYSSIKSSNYMALIDILKLKLIILNHIK
jgi:hypothetical protein